MTEAPDKIWAWYFALSEQHDVIQGGWTKNLDKHETEYTRSDLIPAMLAEARAEWFRNLIKAADSLGYHCTGCGHICKDPDKDLTILRKTGALSCCPEREMEPLSAPILALLDQPSGDRHE